MVNYSLEFLIEKFSEHEIQSMKISKECVENFVKFNPGKPIPDHLLDDFNFPSALTTICLELYKIKKQLEIK